MAVSFCGALQAAQSVSLAWDPSPDTNVIGYLAHFGIASGAYPWQMEAGTNTTATFSGLTEGQTYFFAVTAYDANQLESLPSNEVAFLVPGVVCIILGSDPTPSTSGTNEVQMAGPTPMFTGAPATGAPPVQITFPVVPGKSYELQATEDFLSWVALWQTTATSNAWVNFTDPQMAALPRRFYRVRCLP